jgi:hypothetical protein
MYMKRTVVLPLFAAFTVFMLFSPVSSQARTVQMNARASTNSSASLKGRREAMRMVPAQAVLKEKIDARKLQPGDKFHAALTATVDLKNGLKLPRGTQLIGTVAQDKMRTNGASTLALRFTQAKLKDGKVVPIKATIVGVSAPASFYEYGAQSSYSAADVWNDKTLKIDQLNAESGVSMHSAVANRNSGVFVTTKKHDVKLPDGAQIALAIAARNSGPQHNAAKSHTGVSSGA